MLFASLTKRSNSMPVPQNSRLRGGSYIPRHAFARYGNILLWRNCFQATTYLTLFCLLPFSCFYKEFAVCDYSLLEHTIGQAVQSPTWILQDGSQWQLNFFPHGGIPFCFLWLTSSMSLIFVLFSYDRQ